jgi:myo-inositol-1(or 4)-monophosphatase
VNPPDPIFLATAVQAVVCAGDIQMAHLGRLEHIDKKGTIDLVTEVDLQVEREFRQAIAERFPDHEVLGEEYSDAGEARHARHCWLFDPVDGTTNYAHGLPIFCSSLALEIDGVVSVAAIYDPTRRELFTAERGGGAFLNGLPIHVSRAEALIDALLVTGFPYNVHQRVDDLVALFGAFIGRARAVRRLGSAALDLCYVAAGRFDGYYEENINPWDIAAGALIVTEAGGAVTGMAGETFDPRRGGIVATNGVLHQEMISTIDGFRSRSRMRTD